MQKQKIFILIIFNIVISIFAGCSNQAESNSAKEDLPIVNPVITDNTKAPVITEINKGFEEFSELENEIIDFISNNYSAIYLDYGLMLTKRYAYINNIPTDIPPGIGEYVSQEFNVYNIDGFIVIIVRLDVPETEGRKHEIFVYNGEKFIKCGESGHSYILLKDSEDRFVAAEQESWDDAINNNIKLSYIEIPNGKLERDVFVDIVNKQDNISGTVYPSWEYVDIENLLNQFELIDDAPTNNLEKEIKNKSFAVNEKYVEWKDLYANFVMYNSKINSTISLYKFSDSEIPNLILDNYVYGIIDGVVLLQGEYDGLEELSEYSTKILSKYFEAIYTY